MGELSNRELLDRGRTDNAFSSMDREAISIYEITGEHQQYFSVA